MPIATKEFHHFNTPPGMITAGRAAGTGAAGSITASTSTGPAYITGAAADGSHFVDQNGQPRLFVQDDAWYLITSAGRFSGNYQADITGYMTARAAQGYTVVEVSAFSFNDGSAQQPYTDGRDWDGLWPFSTSNNPSSGLNNTFWARRDYLLATAAAHGITVNMTFTGSTGTVSANNTMEYGFTTAQWSAYGSLLGARYKNTPNLMWICGDEVPAGFDAGYSAWLTAARAAGDTHLISIQNGYPTTSRQNLPEGTGGPLPNSFGPSYAQYNYVYDYCQPYNGVIPAMAEPVSLATTTIPVVWSDGFYLDQGVTGTTPQHLMRNNWWWSLTSGACGVGSGDGGVYEMPANFLTYITSGSGAAGNFYTKQAPAINAAFTALPGWWKLVPDATSALVTSGRGTYVPAGAFYYTSNTDTYVTAAYAADKSLAVIYLSHPGSITINQAMMTAGYTATWIDPASGATSSATPGTTYNSTAKGNNSEGDADWVLALKGP